MRSTRPLTCLLNVCMDSIWFLLLLLTVYTQSHLDWYANYCTNTSESFFFFIFFL